MEVPLKHNIHASGSYLMYPHFIATFHSHHKRHVVIGCHSCDVIKNVMSSKHDDIIWCRDQQKL